MAETQTTQPKAESAGSAAAAWKARSAGHTRQGRHGGANLSYICNMEFESDNGRGGFYAVADGALSARDGDSASESAVETLKAAAQRRGCGAADMLDECVGEAHRALRDARNGMAPDEHFVASLVCGSLNGEDFHTAHAGNGAIFLAHGGRIQRLTENYRLDDVNDPALSTDFGGKSLLGFNPGRCRASLLSVKVAPGDAIIICSGGVTETVDSVSMLEAVKSAASPEEIINSILKKAEARECPHDLAVVAVMIESPEAAKKRPAAPVADAVPGKLIAYKYLTILTLVTVLSMLLYFGGAYFSAEKSRAPEVGKQAGKSAAAADKAVAAPGENEVAMTLDTAPRGAYVLINGLRQPVKTPATINVPAKGSFLLTIVMAGYQSNTQLVEAPKDTNGFSLTVDLLPDLEPPGDLKVSCEGVCAYLRIDGKTAEDVDYPVSGAVGPISLAPGTHIVEAGNNGLRKIQQIEIASGKATEAVFRFSEPAEGASAPKAGAPAAPAPGRAPAARVRETSGVEQVDEQPAKVANTRAKIVVHDIKADEDDAAAAAPKPAAAAPKASGDKAGASFVIVRATSADGDIAGARVKFLQGGRLSATGYSGEAVKLAPGTYEYVVTKEGYKPYTGRKYFGAGAEAAQVFMSR